MPRKILIIERDDCLVANPPDGKLDSVSKVRLAPGVMPAMLRLSGSGYEFVIVSNQAGLGSANYPRETFDAVQSFLVELFASQGIDFLDVRVCPHDELAVCECRLPAAGLVADYLADEALDRTRSAAIGAQGSGLALARNVGLRGFEIAFGGLGGTNWANVAHELLDRPRVAIVERKTRETDVRVKVDLDATEDPVISTGIGFFDHMLEQLGKHGGFALTVSCRGDLEVDEHHTIEDVALSIGRALSQALGEKRGIQRYGFVLPMDEAEACVSIDLGGRAYLVFEGEFPRQEVGGMPTELVPHFFRSLADTLRATLHISVEGDNTHHMIEACFKGVARTLRQAMQRQGQGLPSTKGSL